MKLSNREKMLIGILLSLLICFGYYKLIFSKQVANLESIRQDRDNLKNQYDTAIQNIASLDKKKEKLNLLAGTILDKTSIFYPTIIQEKTILELDKFLSENNVKGNISFTPVEVAKIEKLTSENKALNDSTLKEYVDKYNDKDSSKSTSPEGSETKAEATVSNGPTCENFKVSISYTANYNNLKALIKALEGYGKKIAITSLTATAASEIEVSGTINLEFFGVPKISEQDKDYLTWTINNIYGKDILFSKGYATGVYNSTVEDQKSNSYRNDFVMALRSTNSELPTLTIGKASDTSRESYLYEDKDNVQDVTIEFNEENGKLYYKYNTSSSYYPKDNTEFGKEFTPAVASNIVLEITSDSRMGVNDKSGVKLKVINKTSKTVNVMVKNDDSSNPRVSITSEGGTVKVG